MKDITEPVPPAGDDEREPPLWRRLTWFAALWVAGLAAISALAWGLGLVV